MLELKQFKNSDYFISSCGKVLRLIHADDFFLSSDKGFYILKCGSRHIKFKKETEEKFVSFDNKNVYKIKDKFYLELNGSVEKFRVSVNLTINGVKRKYAVHQLVADCYLKDYSIDSKDKISHKDQNIRNNDISNLKLKANYLNSTVNVDEEILKYFLEEFDIYKYTACYLRKKNIKYYSFFSFEDFVQELVILAYKYLPLYEKKYLKSSEKYGQGMPLVAFVKMIYDKKIFTIYEKIKVTKGREIISLESLSVDNAEYYDMWENKAIKGLAW